MMQKVLKYRSEDYMLEYDMEKEVSKHNVTLTITMDYGQKRLQINDVKEFIDDLQKMYFEALKGDY